MKYFCPIQDTNNYIHSIDNCIIEYDIKDIGTKGINKLIDKIHDIKDKYRDIDYWERLNVNACSKYQWYNNHIHLDNGIYISIGRYTEYVEQRKEKFFIYPIMKLEINPNKHSEKPILKDVLELLKGISSDGRLIKYDYAVDIPVGPKEVEVFGSRKEFGLYKGTRYYGQKNKNGYCKIYDKQKEQELDTPLTRVEHTISTTKTTKNISFENIYIKQKNDNDNTEKINSTYKCIVDLCNTLKANSLDYEHIINNLDKRTKRTVKEYMTKSEYIKLEFDEKIHDKLLNNIKEFFKIKEILTVNDNDFVQIDNDYKNPWE